MVRKINLVTNRLVERNADIQKQTEIMRGKEEICVEIRKLLQRSPGLETPEERMYMEHLVAGKKRQLESLKRELQTAEGQTMYYRRQVGQINEVYKKIKQKYFAMNDNKDLVFLSISEMTIEESESNKNNEIEDLQENEEEPEKTIKTIFVHKNLEEDLPKEFEGEGADFPLYLPPALNE